MRFLLDWQHLTPTTRLSGAEALGAALAQLEGFEAAAGAWESELLPSRIEDYSSGWLDELCRAGRIGWNRLRSGGGSSGPVRATPIVLLPRRQLAVWTSIAERSETPAAALSSRAQAVAEALAAHGALFFDELLDAARLLRSELEDALGEVVSAGRVTADSFAGLRALLLPAAKRDAGRHRRVRRNMLADIEDAGRWSLVRAATLASAGEVTPAALLPLGEKMPGRADEGRVLAKKAPGARSSTARGKPGPSPRPSPQRGEGDEVEHIARTLLHRYGVVFWKLLEREAPWLPSWRELLRVYHRLEARGEIRGGRFVEGLVGEQFALPEAIGQLRSVRQRPNEGLRVTVSGSDPLNLVGTVLAGDKLPALAGTRVLYEDGVAVAALVANKPQFLLEAEGATRQRWLHALLRRADPPASLGVAG
jgi:ATP-dependent Lhr-like helicase